MWIFVKDAAYDPVNGDLVVVNNTTTSTIIKYDPAQHDAIDVIGTVIDKTNSLLAKNYFGIVTYDRHLWQWDEALLPVLDQDGNQVANPNYQDFNPGSDSTIVLVSSPGTLGVVTKSQTSIPDQYKILRSGTTHDIYMIA
jgi:hypothetical protein